MEVKSREDVLAERKLRKAAKQIKKQSSGKKHVGDSNTGKVPDCSELNEKIETLKVSDTESSSPASSKSSTTTNKITSSEGSNERNVSKTSAIKNAEKSVEKTPDSANIPQEAEMTKSKAQLKAERRAIQVRSRKEAQRTMKAQKKLDEESFKTETSVKSKVKTGTWPKVQVTKENKVPVIKTNDPNKVKMVSHLYLDTSAKKLDILKKYRSGIHQSVIKLGLQYKHKIIIGSNARVVAFLNTLKQVLTDYSCEHNFPREFEVVLESTIQYLRTCRQPAVSMTNSVKFLKWHLTQFPNNIPSPEGQIKLRAVIDDYLEKIDLAGRAISETVRKKISQNDVILIFGYSSLIRRILKESFESGIKFRVVIVDVGPLYEGKQLLRKLAKKGLPCTYVLLSAASYIMKEATKVLLGAHALLTNGYVMSRAGTSQIALIARSYNVPVLVCCETHKFSERVQTDALVYNELGDPLPLMKTNQSKSNNYMKSLTLMYDVTPSDLVTAVVTELAILPCTSVPVVLRVKPANPSFN